MRHAYDNVNQTYNLLTIIVYMYDTKNDVGFWNMFKTLRQIIAIFAWREQRELQKSHAIKL